MSFSLKSDLSVETSSLPRLSWLLDAMPWDKWNHLRNSRSLSGVGVLWKNGVGKWSWCFLATPWFFFSSRAKAPFLFPVLFVFHFKSIGLISLCVKISTLLLSYHYMWWPWWAGERERERLTRIISLTSFSWEDSTSNISSSQNVCDHIMRLLPRHLPEQTAPWFDQIESVVSCEFYLEDGTLLF